jgi:uncharacterized protein YcbK (DUF882 family)
MDPINIHRRKWLALGGVAMGMAMLPGQALATLSTPRPRILVLNNLNTGEQLKAEFSTAKTIFKKSWLASIIYSATIVRIKLNVLTLVYSIKYSAYKR